MRQVMRKIFTEFVTCAPQECILRCRQAPHAVKAGVVDVANHVDADEDRTIVDETHRTVTMTRLKS